MFQFQCGAIGSEKLRAVQAKAMGFNSSVVRLVAQVQEINSIGVSLFQFQCGAIGSQKSAVKMFLSGRFQFQCGAIGRHFFNLFR